eukprot:7989256-Lingulodinium_polyedra.AAC.1
MTRNNCLPGMCKALTATTRAWQSNLWRCNVVVANYTLLRRANADCKLRGSRTRRPTLGLQPRRS